MLFELKNYIENLKLRKLKLEAELRKINAELNEISSMSRVETDEPKVISTFEVCSTCNGTGEYDDWMAGNSPCPDCGNNY